MSKRRANSPAEAPNVVRQRVSLDVGDFVNILRGGAAPSIRIEDGIAITDAPVPEALVIAQDTEAVTAQERSDIPLTEAQEDDYNSDSDGEHYDNKGSWDRPVPKNHSRWLNCYKDEDKLALYLGFRSRRDFGIFCFSSPCLKACVDYMSSFANYYVRCKNWYTVHASLPKVFALASEPSKSEHAKILQSPRSSHVIEHFVKIPPVETAGPEGADILLANILIRFEQDLEQFKMSKKYVGLTARAKRMDKFFRKYIHEDFPDIINYKYHPSQYSPSLGPFVELGERPAEKYNRLYQLLLGINQMYDNFKPEEMRNYERIHGFLENIPTGGVQDRFTINPSLAPKWMVTSSVAEIILAASAQLPSWAMTDDIKRQLAHNIVAGSKQAGFTRKRKFTAAEESDIAQTTNTVLEGLKQRVTESSLALSDDEESIR